MTGIYIRVKRNDEWQSIEIENLERIELDAFLATKEMVWKDNLIAILCTAILGCEQE